MEAQAEIAAKFDPTETNIEAIQTQINELYSQHTDIMSRVVQDNDDANKLSLAQVDMHKALDSLLDKYEDQSNRDKANANLLQLINIKTNSKLPDDLDLYTLYHTGRATDFMKLINERDPDLLLDEEKLDAFTNEETYKNFEWKNIE